MASETDSLLEKLDGVAPIRKFDAFPKLPPTYKSRTTGGGFITISIILLSILLVMNDLYEYVWGWPDQEFSVDTQLAQIMTMNVDIVVNMPCHYLSVDLRDAVGERLHLSNQFRRDGTTFDVGQAEMLQNYQTRKIMDASEAVTLSRKSRGLFSWLRGSKKAEFPPTYNYRPDARACRVYGSVHVKKVTGNLHITTLGHGYGSHEHTDHNMMNLSHIITEFSFGPYIPDIVQPLDGSYESTDHRFTVFQYFMNIVPTTYHASTGSQVHTNQYSVTHYVKEIQHGEGAPGIYFKFDIDPMSIDVYQRTTTFIQFLLRVVGVVGGVWVCASWAFKIGNKAVEVAIGSKNDEDLLADAHSTSRKSRWTGGTLSRRMLGNGNAWEDATSPGWTATPITSFSTYSHPPSSASTSNASATGPYSTTPNVGARGPWANGETSIFPPSLPGSAAASHFPFSPLPPAAPSPYSSSFRRSLSGGSAPPSGYHPGRVSPNPSNPLLTTNSTPPRASSRSPNRVTLDVPAQFGMVPGYGEEKEVQ
ncbi:endoplasmic reticulum vesicle transporter-domain-containing protein [Cantharellus anzutake]|uniref:endoplasmic reticulum vesicle transporter-domain-containing protein n=1 Tax=Cantharellus anzutake TaxID=1750568 RepID=UPI00190514B2|nr:endoplasmic reticulum vesicle transporter-domain-containing protein [Cantharellus anzutake]KAF8339786.1 endoplasmic reticulum vesicle transporter-domain-containing protein [Cantharellus anzutake]